MTEVKTETISREVIDRALSYEQYRNMIDSLYAEGKTTGENHSESKLHYTKMNVFRMRRLDKQIELDSELVEKLMSIDRSLIWLVLTEAWCGDAAQLVPLMHRMAQMNPNISLKLILRDENLDIMDEFLTNGKSRSIPKLICLDAKTLTVLGDWGPRPVKAQELFDTVKSMPDTPSEEAKEQLHKWYADDKTKSSQKEFLLTLNEWL